MMSISEGRSPSPVPKEKHKKRKKDHKRDDDAADGSTRHKKHKKATSQHKDKEDRRRRHDEEETPLPKAALDEEEIVNGDDDAALGIGEDKMKELEASQEKEKLMRMRLELKMKQYQKIVKENAVGGASSSSAEDLVGEEKKSKGDANGNVESGNKAEDAKVVDDMFRDFIVEKMNLADGAAAEGEKAASSSDKEKKKKCKKDKEKDRDKSRERDRDKERDKGKEKDKERDKNKERDKDRDNPSRDKDRETRRNRDKRDKANKDAEKKDKDDKKRRREDKEADKEAEKPAEKENVEKEASGFGKFNFKDLIVNYTDDSSSDSDISMTEIDAMLAGECSLDILDSKREKKRKEKEKVEKEEKEKKKKKKEKEKKKKSKDSSSARRSRSSSSSSSSSSLDLSPDARKKKATRKTSKKQHSRSRSPTPDGNNRRRGGNDFYNGRGRGRYFGGGGGRYDDYYSNQRWGPVPPQRGGGRRGGRYNNDNDDRKRSKSPSTKARSRPRSRERSPELKIDKAKLLEIARANALRAMQAGVLPPGVAIPNMTREEEASMKAGGKDLIQLTNFCKKISEKEGGAEEGDDAGDDPANRMKTDEEEESLNPVTGTAIHHPFALKAPTHTITLNIRNATQLPAKPHEERTIECAEKLRTVFPVSSGNQHREKEIEWHEVTPEEKAKMEEEKKNLKKQMALMPWVASTTPSAAVPKEERVFDEPEQDIKNMDIGSVVTERLNAMRKLQDNPLDVEALKIVQKAQDAMQNWAKSKEAPGLFTGSTGVVQKPENILPTGDPRVQAWVKKDMFRTAAPVQSHMGRRLLEKMGWRDGMALGKSNEGALEPLILDIKTDRKGLMSQEEGPKKPMPVVTSRSEPVLKDLSGKHPVSALMELAVRKKWGPPQWEIVEMSGPHHSKNFMFKVHVGGTWYQPTVASNNKKHAKAMAATVCLQAMGLLPRDAVVPDG